MSDPRIERTRSHVLETTRRLLTERSGTALTLSSLAQEARVSRRTLYTYWGTIERVIGDAVVVMQPDENFAADLPLDQRERLEYFLKSVRTGISEPVTSVALAGLMSQAVSDDHAVESLKVMGSRRMGHFASLLGEVSPEIYAQLVGPIFFAEFTQCESASDALIAQLVERGMALLAARAVPIESDNAVSV